MNKLSKLMLLPALLLGATACSSDNLDEPNNGAIVNADQVYMTFDITTLDNSGTRSETVAPGQSDSGNETPYDYENEISSVTMVIVDNNGNVVTKSTDYQAAGTGKWTVSFDSSSLLNFVGDASKDVKFYIFCNIPNEKVQAEMGTTFNVNQVIDLAGGFNAWTNDKFWMSNADNDNSRALPNKTELQQHNTATNPYDYTTGNPFKVKRICARIDYKEGVANSVYPMYDYKYVAGELVKDNSKIVANVTLKDMALLNEATHVNTLIRVSNDGTANASANLQVLGAETKTNFIVAWDWQEKNAWAATPTAGNYAMKDYYNNYFASQNYLPVNGWKNIASLTTDDRDEGSWPHADHEGYKIFEYLLPNTLSMMAQMKGLTTGVVFRGEITFPAGSDIATELAKPEQADADIYVYGNKICGTWSMMENVVSGLSNVDRLKVDYLAAMEVIGSSTDPDVIAAAAVQQGFKRVKKSSVNLGGADTATSGYFVYYYYWNRHNDNHDPYVMGPMEFSVVRNNVYKLSVTGINMIGHTFDPADDPDPEDPEDPDESGKVYLKVEIQVLPWVVRINDIQF